MIRVRTGYSFRYAAGMIEDVMTRLKETDSALTYAPISDRASTFGWVRWTKLASKAGLRPIYGVELGVTQSVAAKKPAVDGWTFFAIDDITALNRLVYMATEQFRYEPLLTYEQAMRAEGVIKIAGVNSLLEEFSPAEDLYVALQPGISKGYATQARLRGHQFIATSDNRYARKEDEGFYQIVCGRGATTQTYPRHLLAPGEWLAATAHIATPDDQRRALAAASAVAGASVAGLKKSRLLTPPKPKTLLAMCHAGAKALGVSLADSVYAARLKRELDLIEEKKFEDYFYIVADMMKYARANMICGPARGSSCGSLVCYLLAITTVDPIKHKLLFERFIDITRNDLPDIDIDFSDQKRDMVVKYMENKYGRDHVARLGTVALYRPRSAIDEAGAALKAPKFLCDRVLDSLIERSGGDARALQTLEDTFATTDAGRELIKKYPEILIAQRMEGHPRHYSQHAAGIVVTDRPVAEYVAVDARTGGVHCDKKDAEELNLLKIDALGLTQLSVFEDCLQMAGKPMDFFESVPLDDPAAFAVLNSGRFSGVFQFNGEVLQKICAQFRIECFEDIVSVTALGRPGPMASGGTNEWVKRKTGVNPVTYAHPILEEDLAPTLGVVTFQEQVMTIGRNMGGLSWADVTALRKAMSKSLGREYFDQFGDKFKAGATAQGVDLEVATKIWDDLCSYGNWAFNRSHAVAYALVSYWCAYAKAYFPVEFAAATLSHTPDVDKQIKTLREMNVEGVDYIPVDAVQSVDKWTFGYTGANNQKLLIGPLTNVAGIGPKLMSQVMSAKARNEPYPPRAMKLLVKPRTKIDSLWPIRDAFARLMPDPAERNIHTSPIRVEEALAINDERTVMVFVLLRKLNLRDENEQVNVNRRGGLIYKSNTSSLNLQMVDDTGQIFCKVDRFKYENMGKPIVERGRVGKALYAVKGQTARGTFKMIRIQAIRYIGDIADEVAQVLADTGSPADARKEAAE